MRRKKQAQMLGKIGCGWLHLPPQMLKSDEPGAALFVGNAEHRGMANQRVTLQQALDFLGLDIAARGNDEPVGAARQIEKARLVEMAEIADRKCVARTQYLALASRIAGKDERAFDEDEP